MSRSLELGGAELLAWRRAQLSKGGEAANLDWLIDLAGGVSWTVLQRLLLDASEARVSLHLPLDELAQLWERHLAFDEPLQHLVGQCPWRDLLLEVSPAALIPRQETELLVDLALSFFGEEAPHRWADLGTGSGAMAVSLSRAWPDSTGHAVDLSGDALDLAERNLSSLAPRHRCCLHQGSWWDPLKPWWGSFDLVVSNPPYIPHPLMAGLDALVRNHEPHLALSGGEDGLVSIRAVVAEATQALSFGGLLLLEHHHDQSDCVLQLMQKAGLEQISAASDLQGVKRFAMGRRCVQSSPSPGVCDVSGA